jgi:hypothetical protein
MNKFKVGDKVRILRRQPGNHTGFAKGWDKLHGHDGAVGYVGIVHEDGTYPIHKDASHLDDAIRFDYYGYFPGEDLELVAQKVGLASVNFLLQYELDEDPFETFATLKEVEDRIKELAKRPDLKRESIKVYEIAKTYDVRLETRVLFGPKVKLEEQPKRKKSAKKRV